MLTLNTGVAVAILAGAVAATGGITFVVTKATVTVSCPAPATTNTTPSGSSALPTGAPVQPYHGKQF
jgi:hypothetical protein